MSIECLLSLSWISHPVVIQKTRVMLVDDNPDRAEWVANSLCNSGFEPHVVATDHVGLLREISDIVPDIVVIDMESPGRDLLESLAIVTRMNPTPVVMFSAEQDPDYINRAVESGVTAYMLGNIEPEKVKPVIDVAMAQFRNFQQLKQELDDTRLELTERRQIDQAKRLLMKHHNLSEDDAYELMRKEAMASRLKIVEVAAHLLEGSTER